MSSEIEVVGEAKGDAVVARGSRGGGAGSAAGAGAGRGAQSEEGASKNDVYTAAIYGDLEKLQRLVEVEGCSVSEPDGAGHYALQWAALNNHTAAAQYIIEHGEDVNVTGNTGQTALHWSAVRGHIQVADLLLKEGARVDAADLNGYRTAHVAAQYGQTAYLYHIVRKWNADPDIPDNDGRSPLHWAALKGFPDCIRLLLFLDAYRLRQDKEGCTPLHWATLGGNLESCTVLVQAGKKEDLMLTDNTGFTPAQLASDKNHRQVAFFLGNAGRVLDKRNGNTFIGKLSKLGYAPVLLCVIIALLLTYIHSVLAGSYFLNLTAGSGLFACSGVFLATAGLIMFYRCSRKDPGYIQRNERDVENLRDDEPLLKSELNHPALLAGNWTQICVTCKIVRPVRAKHCATCDRCVEQFDHHCPWVSNCIGKKNKWDFLLLLVLEDSAMIVTGAVTMTRIVRDPSPSSFGGWLSYTATKHPGALAFLIMDFFLFCQVAFLTVVQVAQIAQNITTNEMEKSVRYSYLRGPGGQFRNPYDHGIGKNCSDFLIKGYNEDVELLEPTSEEMGMIEMKRSRDLQNEDHHLHQNNKNELVSIDAQRKNSNSHGHVHSSKCNHNGSKSDTVSLGLGLGLGRNHARHNSRSVLPL